MLNMKVRGALTIAPWKKPSTRKRTAQPIMSMCVLMRCVNARIIATGIMYYLEKI